MKLTARQLDLLETLALPAKGDEFWRPMDLGAYDSSHHSGTLAGLVKRGLVERRRRYVGISGGSWVYRITDAGRAEVGPVAARLEAGGEEE